MTRAALWSVNPEVLKQCRAWLDDNNHNYQLCIGKYKGQLEFSFATWEDTLLEAIKTGWLCGQETVILNTQNTATLYAVTGDAMRLARIQSGAMHKYDKLPKIDADYTYFPKHRLYMSIHWYH